MQTPFKSFISNSQSLLNNLEIAQILYSSLEVKLNETPGEPSFEQICSTLFEVFNSQIANSCYFSTMSSQITYEWALELYWMLLRSQTDSKKQLSDSVLTRLYLNAKDKNIDKEDSASNMYERRKKDIIKQFSNQNSATSSLTNHKYNNYKTVIQPLATDNTLIPGTIDIDNYLYIRSHMDTPFSVKNINNGMIFPKYQELITQYLKLHPTFSLENEISAFIFEKLYSSVSYQLCVRELAENCNTNKLPVAYWPLYTFTKLFDTHHISLIKYTQEVYFIDKNLFFDIDKGRDLRYASYYDFQQYNCFYLPLFLHILALYLNNYYEGKNFNIIANINAYIEKILSDPETVTYSYYWSLKNVFRSISQLAKTLYQKNTKIDEIKYSIICPANQSSSKWYTFSSEICKLFFNIDTPLLIQSYYNMNSVLNNLTNIDLADDISYPKTKLPISVMAIFNFLTQRINNDYYLTGTINPLHLCLKL